MGRNMLFKISTPIAITTVLKMPFTNTLQNEDLSFMQVNLLLSHAFILMYIHEVKYD